MHVFMHMHTNGGDVLWRKMTARKELIECNK